VPIQLARSISTPRRRDAGVCQEVEKNYVLCPQGVHGALMTTGQDNDQKASKGRGQDADANQEKEPDAYRLWHRRLGHAAEEKMKLFQTAWKAYLPWF
jgi:hypothetical protein